MYDGDEWTTEIEPVTLTFNGAGQVSLPENEHRTALILSGQGTNAYSFRFGSNLTALTGGTRVPPDAAPHTISALQIGRAIYKTVFFFGTAADVLTVHQILRAR